MMVKLIVFRRDRTRRDFQLADGLTTLGRGSDCEVRIPLAVVSRRHAEIAISDDGVVLRDLNAANGTFLNNHRVVSEANLEPGDRIMVGQVIFTVQIDGKPPDDEISRLCTTVSAGGDAARVGTSKHVYTSDDEIDPIAALEALASSADQTVIEPEQDDE